MSEVILICPRAAQNRESALTFDCCWQWPLDLVYLWHFILVGGADRATEILLAKRRKISMKEWLCRLHRWCCWWHNCKFTNVCWKMITVAVESEEVWRLVCFSERPIIGCSRCQFNTLPGPTTTGSEDVCIQPMMLHRTHTIPHSWCYVAQFSLLSSPIFSCTLPLFSH